MDTIKRGSGSTAIGEIEERVKEVRNIFTFVGLKDWKRALRHSPNGAVESVKAGQRVVAELDDDEELFFSLLDYLCVSGGEDGSIPFQYAAKLRESFWTVIRARYGFSEHGDLGVRRDSEERLVLVEKPEDQTVNLIDLESLMSIARAGRA